MSEFSHFVHVGCRTLAGEACMNFEVNKYLGFRSRDREEGIQSEVGGGGVGVEDDETQPLLGLSDA